MSAETLITFRGYSKTCAFPTGCSQATPSLGSIDQLRRENEGLRDQLNEARRMMNQLLLEGPNENYTQRWVLTQAFRRFLYRISEGV